MPSKSQRSSVRGFRRSSAANSSFVRNSERIGSELDIANSYALFSVRIFALRVDLRKRDNYSELGGGFPPIFLSNGDCHSARRLRDHSRAPLIA